MSKHWAALSRPMTRAYSIRSGQSVNLSEGIRYSVVEKNHAFGRTLIRTETGEYSVLSEYLVPEKSAS